MIIISHSAIVMNDTVTSLMGFSQLSKKEPVLALIRKHRLMCGVMIHHMMTGIFVYKASFLSMRRVLITQNYESSGLLPYNILLPEFEMNSKT